MRRRVLAVVLMGSVAAGAPGGSYPAARLQAGADAVNAAVGKDWRDNAALNGIQR